MDLQGTIVLLMMAIAIASVVYFGLKGMAPPQPLTTEEKEERREKIRIRKEKVSREEEQREKAQREKLQQQKAPVEYPPEHVQFTAYRPKQLVAATWAPFLVFAHLEDRPLGSSEALTPIEEVRRQAERLLGDSASAYLDKTKDSRHKIPREAEITLRPEVAGVRFNPPVRSFFWTKGVEVHREEFSILADPDKVGRVLSGNLTIFLGSLILAEVRLDFPIVSAPDPRAIEQPLAPAPATPFRRVFPSYSRRDLQVVEQIELYSKTLGDDYLRDLVSIRPGEEWNPRLQELIAQADVFQLFWSSNSANSRFVEEEWRFAAGLRRLYFIRPTYWEEPLPTVPNELAALHFQKLWIRPYPDTTGEALKPRIAVIDEKATGSGLYDLKWIDQNFRPLKGEEFRCLFDRSAIKEGDLLCVSRDRTRTFEPANFHLLNGKMVPHEIDSSGRKTPSSADRACPNCELRLPSAYKENHDIFSIVGQPGSGKSYYLATLIHKISTILYPMGFGFVSDDAELNQEITPITQIPFKDGPPEDSGRRFIKKTDENEERTQRLLTLKSSQGGSVQLSVPRPFIYRITQISGNEMKIISRPVFYDNPGEHWIDVELTGMETSEPMRARAQNSKFATSHISLSSAIFVLCDPTAQGERFGGTLNRVDNQTTMITKLIQTLRESNETAPIAVLLVKWDAWQHMDGAPRRREKVSKTVKGSFLSDDQLAEVEARSEEAITFLTEIVKCDFPVSFASISNPVCYFPISTYGDAKPYATIINGATVYPPDSPVTPWDVELPFLWALRKIEENRKRRTPSIPGLSVGRERKG